MNVVYLCLQIKAFLKPNICIPTIINQYFSCEQKMKRNKKNLRFQRQ